MMPNRPRLKGLGTILGVGAVLWGCGCATTGAGASGSSRLQPLTVKRESVDHAPEDLVIRSSAELEDLWREADLHGSPPQIDFAREMVVATFRGRLPNNCYATRIVEVTRQGEGARVWVEDVDPGAHCICGMAITFPSHIVRVPRADGPVRFRHRRVVEECNRSRRP